MYVLNKTLRYFLKYIILNNFSIQVENAVRQGHHALMSRESGMQAQKKNVELKRVTQIQFRCHKVDHIHSSMSASSDPQSVSSATECVPTLFKNHKEFTHYASSSLMAPLYQLHTNGPLQQCNRLNLENESSQRKCDLQMEQAQMGYWTHHSSSKASVH